MTLKSIIDEANHMRTPKSVIIEFLSSREGSWVPERSLVNLVAPVKLSLVELQALLIGMRDRGTITRRENGGSIEWMWR